MTTFDDRQKAFETKFAHDEEMRFRILARRGKLIGLWAAEKLGKDGQAADDYAKSVLLSDLEIPGDDDIILMSTQLRNIQAQIVLNHQSGKGLKFFYHFKTHNLN